MYTGGKWVSGEQIQSMEGSHKVKWQLRQRQGWTNCRAQHDATKFSPRRIPNTHVRFFRVLLCFSASPIAAAPSLPMLLPSSLCSRGSIKQVRVPRAPKRRRGSWLPAHSLQPREALVALERLSNRSRALVADDVTVKPVQWRETFEKSGNAQDRRREREKGELALPKTYVKRERKNQKDTHRIHLDLGKKESTLTPAR